MQHKCFLQNSYTPSIRLRFSSPSATTTPALKEKRIFCSQLRPYPTLPTHQCSSSLNIATPFTTTTTHRLILLSFDFVFLTVFLLFLFLLEHRTRINDSCRWLAMSARKFPHSICYLNGERDSRSRNGDRKMRSNSFAKGCDCATVWLLLPVAAGCRRLRRPPYLQM